MRKRTVSVTTPKPVEKHDPVEQFLNWLNTNRRSLLAAGTVVVVAAAAVYFFITAQQRKEQFAATELENARAVIASGNMALAASDLSQLISTYGGTTAAEEASIVLARVRLMERQPAAAIVELNKLIQEGPGSQFVAPAHGLLAAAHEQAGNFDQAAAEYRIAAEAAWYDFLKAEYLVSAGRVLTATGDTAGAISAYEQVIEDYPDDHSAIEARVRLGELSPTT
jgi:predicted negative regulator of RcsB-dependent stress response